MCFFSVCVRVWVCHVWVCSKTVQALRSWLQDATPFYSPLHFIVYRRKQELAGMLLVRTFIGTADAPKKKHGLRVRALIGQSIA